MVTTPNLGITHIETQQSQKEVTANEAFDVLDEGLAGELIHDFASDANYTLDVSEPDKEDENLVLHMTDTSVNLTTTRDVILPDVRQLHVAWNDTAETLNFKTSGGTGPAVGAGDISIIYCDATNVEILSDAGASLAFLSLTDVAASSYSGETLKLVRVNAGETGLEFVTAGVSSATHFNRPFKGAGVHLTSDAISVDASGAGLDISWDAETYDSDDFVDIGSEATRITIPSGFSFCQFYGQVGMSNVTAGSDIEIAIYKNGAIMTGFGGTIQDLEVTETSPNVNLTSPVFAITNTDYFELHVTCTDSDIDLEADRTWFAMTAVELDSAVNPPYDIGFFFAGAPTNAQEILRFTFTRDVTMVASATGSYAESRVASIGDVTFDFKNNGAASFATCRFNITATGVFTMASEENFVDGDVLTVLAPATADANLVDIGFTLKMTRDAE